MSHLHRDPEDIDLGPVPDEFAQTSSTGSSRPRSGSTIQDFAVPRLPPRPPGEYSRLTGTEVTVSDIGGQGPEDGGWSPPPSTQGGGPWAERARRPYARSERSNDSRYPPSASNSRPGPSLDARLAPAQGRPRRVLRLSDDTSSRTDGQDPAQWDADTSRPPGSRVTWTQDAPPLPLRPGSHLRTSSGPSYTPAPSLDQGRRAHGPEPSVRMHSCPTTISGPDDVRLGKKLDKTIRFGMIGHPSGTSDTELIEDMAVLIEDPNSREKYGRVLTVRLNMRGESIMQMQRYDYLPGSIRRTKPHILPEPQVPQGASSTDALSTMCADQPMDEYRTIWRTPDEGTKESSRWRVPCFTVDDGSDKDIFVHTIKGNCYLGSDGTLVSERPFDTRSEGLAKTRPVVEIYNPKIARFMRGCGRDVEPRR